MGTDDNPRDQVDEKTDQANEKGRAKAGEPVRDPAEDLKDPTIRADPDSRDPAEDLKAYRD